MIFMMQLLYTQRMWRSCIILDSLKKPFNMQGMTLRLCGVFERKKSVVQTTCVWLPMGLWWSFFVGWVFFSKTAFVKQNQ